VWGCPVELISFDHCSQAQSNDRLLADRLSALPANLHLPITPRLCRNIIIQHYVPMVTGDYFYFGHTKDIVLYTHLVFHNYLGTLATCTRILPVYSADGPFPCHAKALVQVPNSKDRKDLRPMRFCELQKGYGEAIGSMKNLVLEVGLLGVIGKHVSTILFGNDTTRPPEGTRYLQLRRLLLHPQHLNGPMTPRTCLQDLHSGRIK